MIDVPKIDKDKLMSVDEKGEPLTAKVCIDLKGNILYKMDEAIKYGYYNDRVEIVRDALRRMFYRDDKHE